MSAEYKFVDEGVCVRGGLALWPLHKWNLIVHTTVRNIIYMDRRSLRAMTCFCFFGGEFVSENKSLMMRKETENLN